MDRGRILMPLHYRIRCGGMFPMEYVYIAPAYTNSFNFQQNLLFTQLIRYGNTPVFDGAW